MTPYERLLLEELPTGEFGGPYTPPPRPRTLLNTSAEDQDQHYADLETAVQTQKAPPRHLRAVPDPAPAQEKRGAA